MTNRLIFVAVLSVLALTLVETSGAQQLPGVPGSPDIGFPIIRAAEPASALGTQLLIQGTQAQGTQLGTQAQGTQLGTQAQGTQLGTQGTQLGNSFTVQPLTVQPLTVQPLTVQPLTVQPLTVQPLTVQPLTVQPLTVQPLTVQPLTVQPLPEASAGGEIGRLVGELHEADASKKPELTKQLEDAVAKQFDHDMENRKTELTKLEERLSKLRTQLDRRRKAKTDIIQLQVKVLVNEADGLGFGGQPLQPGGLPEVTTRGGPNGSIVTPVPALP